MIVVDIVQRSEKVAVEISKFLIHNKYAIHTHIDTNKIFGNDSEMTTVRLFL